MEVKSNMSEEVTQTSARSFIQIQLAVSEAKTPDLEGCLILKVMGKTWTARGVRRHT